MSWLLLPENTNSSGSEGLRLISMATASSDSGTIRGVPFFISGMRHSFYSIKSISRQRIASKFERRTPVSESKM
jgi:hypothetical protein